MKLLALGLEHHRLDNKCSAKFKACIGKTRMTHKLIPSDCSPNRLSRHSKTVSSPSSVESMIDFPSPCGAISCNQRNSLSTYYNRAVLHQKFLHMPMSTGNTMGLTKRTLCGIVLFKLNTCSVMFRMSLVLILHVFRICRIYMGSFFSPWYWFYKFLHPSG